MKYQQSYWGLFLFSLALSQSLFFYISPQPMEKLKSVIPQTLIYSISQSKPNDLPATCSSVHDFLHQFPDFHQMIKDLTHKETSLCGKNKEAALEFKLKGNDCFSNGQNSNALRFYTQALRFAPGAADDAGKNLVATIYVNRAAVLQRMGLLVESLRDCGRAIAICSSYAKAWFRRGKANNALGKYDVAACDFKVAMCMEHSLSGKRQVESELKSVLDQQQHHKKDISLDETNDKKSDFLDQPQQIQLQCVSTETKGRGMVSLTNVPEGTLLHTEEPYAAVILKHCRETHCHFCFNELPADIVPCPSCSKALYCSQMCQIQARGQEVQGGLKNNEIKVDLSGDLDKYIGNVTRASYCAVLIQQNAEHSHECEGINWPAVLPAEIVLAGRVLVKSIQQHKHFGEASSIVNLELCHNYVQLVPETKLELHLSSIVLLHCLKHSCGSDFPINGITISQCVLLLSQIKVNSMAIVRMKCFDSSCPANPSRTLSPVGGHTTSIVEQVRVGQALYLDGCLFNHSCQPNINTFFLSRSLYIRATEFVAAGHPLELSYGPQVGQWNCKDRQQSLKEQYSFECQCPGCSKLNLSDLVISAFRCLKPNCPGVVLDSSVAKYEKQKVNSFSNGILMQAEQLEDDDIKRVASLLDEETGCPSQIRPGYCLSCDTYSDLKASNAIVSKAETSISRLEEALASTEVPTNTLAQALRSHDHLKSALHPYNKKVAEVEDYLAQAFCSIGELQHAKDHCATSIEILEKLYGHDHIVIGNELVKLASIQLSLGESAVVESINRIESIFSRYYGSHAGIVFPHLQFLKKEASRVVQ